MFRSVEGGKSQFKSQAEVLVIELFGFEGQHCYNPIQYVSLTKSKQTGPSPVFICLHGAGTKSEYRLSRTRQTREGSGGIEWNGKQIESRWQKIQFKCTKAECRQIIVSFLWELATRRWCDLIWGNKYSCCQQFCIFYCYLSWESFYWTLLGAFILFV